ncbi:hypothetical protein SODALDRAFT_275310 [Sodiomyces alkalinus F11]|uniref:Uncharacterized protein n=1 Tax=Sodiomyces alkalinus (strain CBS 110278 / VKM F-3762 / F11) TaxID=1314773 RepID=A0A3N2PZE1_SODAK|nr:hypothetical protein SODALDRAFT_275310 [Sodiomyces alkalinus F11]ROT39890.1 hypothetical protein SODALDRAFT_275310 [Sodiomyces alkalinus F11]
MHLQRGVRPGGLKASKWASAPDSSSSWATRDPSHYIPRSSAINPAVPISSDSEIPVHSAPSNNDRWWEQTPTPKLKREAVAPSATGVHPGPTALSGSGSSNNHGLVSSQREFRRYVQIVRRMKWKLPYLQYGYHLAVSGHNPDLQEAELMFKLDFYEYYMLLERALVHLLGVFGVAISPGRSHQNGNGRGDGNANGTARGAHHQYHQNVLAALDSKQNPLHAALGTGEVRQHLGRAKELRNRWKYAEDPAEAAATHAMTLGAGARGEDLNPVTGRAPLESYDLDSMFKFIFNGFDQGYAIAEAWIDDLARRADMVPDAWTPAMQAKRIAEEEAEFDFIVDAMDWEAV